MLSSEKKVKLGKNLWTLKPSQVFDASANEYVNGESYDNSPDKMNELTEKFNERVFERIGYRRRL